MKFSGSISKFGENSTTIPSTNHIITILIRSFTEKYGWNLIESHLEDSPRGFLDPLLCKYSRWISEKRTITIGRMKWNA